jgi:trehalose 6-phosphate phosphatase
MTIPNLLSARPEIAARIERSASILLGLDFDGTLTPLVAHADEAVLSDSVRALLARLSRVDQVAVMIVSGRSLPDVTGRVGLPGLIYAGNHGLEIEGRGLAFLEPTAAACAAALDRITSDLRTTLADWPGVLVEAKRLTTSVHYRLVPDERWDDLARIVHERAAADPLQFVLTSGHRVWEIRPRVAWHKGHALDWTSRHLGEHANRLIFYLGDDRTDEDAFASLPDAITVKIGDHRSPTRAHYWLPDPESVCRFLDWLAGSIPTGARAAPGGRP